ncbi:MAG: serine/threonine-protein phosphatase [Acidobacteria bacterium]|nr:serine/threonine-protein phosphatase [Acidobacteriota bacterium]
MKTLRYIFRKYYGTLERRLRKAAGRVSPASALFIVEAVAACVALSVVLTGSRAASLDRFGGRADIGAIVAAAALLLVLHCYLNRSVLARLDRHLPVRAYDERRILFDLGQAARGVTNTNQIYDFVVREIADALRATNVSVFVRDDTTGDYVCRVSSEKLEIGIAIADVAGKGISAALLMSSVQASLRSQAMNHRACDDGRSLAELVSTMNHLMHRSTGAASYVTFFYAQFDEKLRTLTYVNAGHNPPMLVRAKTSHDFRAGGGPQALSSRTAHWSPMANGVTTAVREAGYGASVAVLEEEMIESDSTNDSNFREPSFEVRELTAGGAVLGVFDDCYYEQETLQMESGDLLVAFTDGLTESLDCEGNEFGEERLRDTLTACAHLSADEVRDVVVGQVREWSAGAAQHDDLTFVVLKVK